MVNFSPQRLRSIGEFWAPKQISMDFASWLRYCTNIMCRSMVDIQYATAEIRRRKNRRKKELEMWANAQRDGRPAEYRRRSLFNAEKFG